MTKRKCPFIFAALCSSAALTLTIITACSGPQSLHVAIHPDDQAAYNALLKSGEESPRLAFYSRRAQQQGITTQEAQDADLALSSNPFSARRDPSAVSRGAVIFQSHCASCHGDGADGQGSQLPRPMPELGFHGFADRFAATVHGGAPTKWFRVINEGATSEPVNESGDVVEMPAFNETLAREQVWLVITYLQSLDYFAEGPYDAQANE